MANRIKTHPTTGKKYYVDDDDTIISEVPSDTQFDAPGQLFRQPDIKPQTTIKETYGPGDQFYNAIGRFIPSVLTAAGSIGGGIAGSSAGMPIQGSAVGAGVGSYTGKLLQTLMPQYLGEYKPKDFKEMEKDIGWDVAIDTATGLAAKGAGYFFPSAMKEGFQQFIKARNLKSALSESQEAAFKAEPFDVSLGQYLGGGWRTIEDTFAGAAKQKLLREQEKKIVQEYGKHSFGPEMLTEVGQQNAAANIAKMQAETDVAYGAFNPNIKKNTQQILVKTYEDVVDPVTNQSVRKVKLESGEIEGAIPLKQSRALADEIGKQIDALAPDDAGFARLDQGTGGYLGQLKREVDKIRKIDTHIDPVTQAPFSHPIGSYEKLQALKTGINRFLYQNTDNPILNDRLRGSLKGLAATIKNDIDEGVKGWGKGAFQQLEHANETYKSMAKKVNNELAERLMNSGMGEKATYTEVARETLSDPQRAREFINATNDKATLKQLYLDDLTNKAMDPAAERFDPNIALNYLLKDKKDVGDVALSKSQKNEIVRSLRRAQIVEPFKDQSSGALKWGARGGIGLAAGLGSWAFGSGFPVGGAMATAGVTFAPTAMRKLVKEVFFDPKNTRVAAQLMNATPRSQTAKWGARTILTLMKGSQVIVRTPDGREYNGIINPQTGKIDRTQ